MCPLIAFPGTDGSFSCLAARELFPGDEVRGYTTFDEVADAVLAGEADYGLLPVENSSAGAVLTTFGLLEKLPLFIVAEHAKAVRHQLLALPGATLSGIRAVASHPQAIAQCDVFLSGMKDVTITPSANTAISAREVAASGDLTRAAIASREAAEAWGLAILAEDIQTNDNNTTRFYVVSRTDASLGRPDKATVVFTVNNEVGALVRVLSSFAGNGLNMSCIESRPLPGTRFEYSFIADFEGDVDKGRLTRALRDAAPYMNAVRLLGVYPKASLR